MKATPQHQNNLFDFSFGLHFICLILKTSPNRFFSTLRSSKKDIIFPFHTQYVKIDSLPKYPRCASVPRWEILLFEHELLEFYEL